MAGAMVAMIPIEVMPATVPEPCATRNDQHELGVCRGRIAEVGGNGPQLLRVQAIVKAVFQALQGRPLIGSLVGFEVGCGRRQSSFPYDKRRLGSAAVFCIFWPP